MKLSDLTYVFKSNSSNNKLIAIDRLIDGVSSDTLESSEILTLVAGVLTLDREGGPALRLAASELDHADTKLAALSLLRCANARKSLWEDVEFTRPLINFCDQAFSQDLYKLLKIDEKDQTYLKIKALEDVLPSLEIELVNRIESWNSLTAAANFRQNFMSKFSSQICRHVIWPFLPKDTVIQQLDELFIATNEYLVPDGQRIQDVADRLADYIESFKRDVSDFGTYHCVTILKPLCEKLNSLFSLHLLNNPICKPANLIIKRPDKKYPLHLPETNTLLAFTIRNLGPGRAFDVTLKVEEITDIQLKQSETFLGSLDEGDVLVEFQGIVSHATDAAMMVVAVSWMNYDGTEQVAKFDFTINGQPTDIEWPSLVKEEPYSMEPVTKGSELIGRKDFLDELLARAQAESVGSSYVTGQKRVGKTSIVKTLKTELEQLKIPDFYVIFLEGGDYTHPDPVKTIEALGQLICNELIHLEPRFGSVAPAKFEGALSPLNEFLVRAMRLVKPFKLLVILDEFDELPMELYKRGSVGDAFFLTLRAVSGKSAYGFILVGSEKMDWILSCQGDALNKFQALRVDYFEKENNWTDFRDLVCRPVSNWLEFSDDALVTLYEIASGNPYFTKLICRSVAKIMLSRRDSHVTEAEIQEAKRSCLASVHGNSFQHFWEDGIFQAGDKAEEISVLRRKLLIAFAESIRQTQPAGIDSIKKNAEKYGLSSDVTEAELREFERRGILIKRDGGLVCKVPFFQEWMRDFGINEIITTFLDPESILLQRKEEENAYITPSEIVSLVSRWTAYKGRSITEDRVRAWLQQFGDNGNQRIAWKILSGLKFYNGNLLREKLREAHGIVHRDLIWRKESTRAKRGDIAVSYLGSPGKSGVIYAKMFADENEVYFENVVECTGLSALLDKEKHLAAVVFVDDFVGTGKTAEAQLDAFFGKCGHMISGRTIQISFIAITGFSSSIDRISKQIRKWPVQVKVHVCDVLDDGDRCFSENSKIFPESSEREKARHVASHHGSRAVKRHPLGFGDCEATVVFENSCPNNCLPVLWGQTKDWTPLFERL